MSLHSFYVPRSNSVIATVVVMMMILRKLWLVWRHWWLGCRRSSLQKLFYLVADTHEEQTVCTWNSSRLEDLICRALICLLCKQLLHSVWVKFILRLRLLPNARENIALWRKSHFIGRIGETLLFLLLGWPTKKFRCNWFFWRAGDWWDGIFWWFWMLAIHAEVIVVII